MIGPSLFLALGLATLAHSGTDDLAGWYRSLRTPTGGSCCSRADCVPVDARQTSLGWEARIGGAWISVPAETVLRRENPDGRPVWCGRGGYTFCFIPPAGT